MTAIKANMQATTRNATAIAAGAQIGAVTHHQDQVTNPVNFKNISISNNGPAMPELR